MYIIQEKNEEGGFVISAPKGSEKVLTFDVFFDKKQGKVVGLPEDLQAFAEGFSAEDMLRNPEEVMKAIQKAADMEREKQKRLHPSENETDTDEGPFGS